MTTSLVTIGCFDSLESAHALLRLNRIRHLPVIDGAGVVVGILSDRDLLRGSLPSFSDDGAIERRLNFLGGSMVQDYMSTALKAIPLHGEIQAAIEVMLEEKISSCLVVEGSEVVGIITYEDLLEMLKGYVSKPSGSLRSSIAAVIANSPLGGISTLLANSGI